MGGWGKALGFQFFMTVISYLLHNTKISPHACIAFLKRPYNTLPDSSNRDPTWFMTDIFQVSVRSWRWLVKCLQYSRCCAVGPCPFGVSSRNRFTSRVQTCQSTAPKKLSFTISHLPSSFPRGSTVQPQSTFDYLIDVVIGRIGF